MDKDLYQILGLSRSASPGEIKRAYKQLARKYHPDLNPGDKRAEDRFKEVSAAYEVLDDEKKRRLYDEFGADAEKMGYDPERAEAYRAWKTQSFGGGRRSKAGQAGGFDLGDLFGDLFGARGHHPRPSRGPQKGGDITAALHVAFLDAVRGVEREIDLERPKRCGTCSGSGIQPGAGPRTCPRCRGSGRVQVAQGPIQMQAPCSECGGTGQVAGPPCLTCGGRGQVNERTRLKVTIPAGVSDGQKVRLRGQGAPGLNGGGPGDLYLTVSVSDHRWIRREGLDLEFDLPVTVKEAMLGAKVEIPTLEGRVGLSVPAGSQSGNRLRLRGKGIKAKGKSAGDLYVRLMIAVPSVADASAEAAEALEAQYEEDVRADLSEGFGA